MTKHIRQDIQILRGLAVLGVILFHVNPVLFRHGYLGVDIFFVISGFLLMPIITRIFSPPHSLHTQVHELFRFFTNRIFRLAPAAGVNNRVIGVALEAATAAGDVIRVLLEPGVMQG